MSTKRQRLEPQRNSFHNPALPIISISYALHPLITDQDAARMLRVSQATSQLMQGYSFDQHVFKPESTKNLYRLLSFFARSRLRITRLALPQDFVDPLFNDRDEPILPSSLIALTFGQPTDEHQRNLFDSIALIESTGCIGSVPSHLTIHESLKYRIDSSSLSEQEFSHLGCDFSRRIPPGSLPSSLKYLQLSASYNIPLQIGALPSTLRLLQCGVFFAQPLEPGVLPNSLTHLLMSSSESCHPLRHGVLPPALQQFGMSLMFDHPLSIGVFPKSLRVLDLGGVFNQPLEPGVIPATVTHLVLSERFDFPLQPGSIPNSCLHLNLGMDYSHRLKPEVLPRSLRELVLSDRLVHPVRAGILPDCLDILGAGYSTKLKCGGIPSSVRCVVFQASFSGSIAAGSLPDTVKYLSLPTRFKKIPSKFLPSSAEITWEREDGENSSDEDDDDAASDAMEELLD